MNISYGAESLVGEGLLPVLTAADMRAADEATIAAGTPAAVLMEVAGRAVADVASRLLEEAGGRRVLVACGKGNNGGDGYVVARVMALRGFDVTVVSTHAREELGRDAGAQFDRLQSLNADDIQGRLTLVAFEADTEPAGFRPDLIVDALLGTGITSKVRASTGAILTGAIIEAINELDVPVVAVDIPSGLHADTGEILGAVVKSTVTVSLGAIKKGLITGEGPAVRGHLEVAEIGIIPNQLRRRADAAGAFLTTGEWVGMRLPRRPADAHKYTAGMALVIGGSVGMTGAPTMTTLAAARAGAGYVCVATPADVQNVIAGKLTTPTTIALPQTKSGGIDASGAMAVLEPWLERARAVAIGPGLGRDRSTLEFVRRFLDECRLPAVVDADALFALSENLSFLERSGTPDWLLTPHQGEFRRLASDANMSNDNMDLARRYAERWNVTLLLKGLPSVVASPAGRVIASGTASSAMATAGTGDVLSGLCTSFMAQGMATLEAAATAMHIGGAASHLFTARHHPSSMIATDLIDLIPAALLDNFS